MKSYLDKAETLSHFSIPEFVYKTQLQINKDFATVGYAFQDNFLESELSYELILHQVVEQIIAVMKLGETTLLQLLYQIDLPQKDFLAITTDEAFAEKLADMIIRREAYKVYLRSKF